MSVWKCVMAATAEELCSVLILYAKFFTLCNIYWRKGFWLAALYGFGWMAISTVFPQPWYRGPTKIYELNETAFRDRVLGRNKQKASTVKPTSSTSSSASPPVSSSSTMSIDDIKGPRITEIEDESLTNKPHKVQEKKASDDIDPKYWVVLLYASWSVSCLNFEAVLAKLSIKYDVPHLKFGQIDVDLYPDLAEEFGVSKDPASFDLPTLILFQNGREIRRLPELTVSKTNGNPTTRTNAAKDTIARLGWSKQPAAVVRIFQLDRIMNEKPNKAL
ncbi:hypothetical protein BDF20DRAFT_666348 [Mycotypha africana]|uniref:uncharacterized protein n=1 Tax=Mycotypha africana TaxID=64632 RepID=UPI002301D027|nr:uncharacterized protein BDF20DRAFT_666348 [Mycotypha africana]KAI8973680.1 hypothetical protein BDF20DRAFT_666348 [Mycotypha africana]